MAAQGQLSNWQLQAEWCLVLLTDMALGGFVHDYAAPAVRDALSREPSIAKNLFGQEAGPSRRFVSFPLPARKSAHHPGQTQDQSRNAAPLKTPTQSNKTMSRQVNPDIVQPVILPSTSASGITPTKVGDAPKVEVRVVCVHFTRALDVELLWIESCKTFADFSNSTVPATSQYSLYCLEVKIDSSSWHTFLTDLQTLVHNI